MSRTFRTFLIGLVGGLLGLVVGLIAFHLVLRTDVLPNPPTANDRVLKALASFVEQRTNRTRNTLYLPATANLGEEMVVYWPEENLLFSFPIELKEEAIRSPELVVRRQWTLDEEHFRPTVDREAATSTYLETWPQAVKWIREAVVDGTKLVHQNGESPIKLPNLP